jgi:hypothetical protein
LQPKLFLKSVEIFLEMLLCMEAWMKQESVDINEVAPRQRRGQHYDSTAKEALRIAMSKYVLVVMGDKGHGLT